MTASTRARAAACSCATEARNSPICSVSASTSSSCSRRAPTASAASRLLAASWSLSELIAATYAASSTGNSSGGADGDVGVTAAVLVGRADAAAGGNDAASGAAVVTAPAAAATAATAAAAAIGALSAAGGAAAGTATATPARAASDAGTEAACEGATELKEDDAVGDTQRAAAVGVGRSGGGSGMAAAASCATVPPPWASLLPWASLVGLRPRLRERRRDCAAPSAPPVHAASPPRRSPLRSALDGAAPAAPVGVAPRASLYTLLGTPLLATLRASLYTLLLAAELPLSVRPTGRRLGLGRPGLGRVGLSLTSGPLPPPSSRGDAPPPR